MMSSAYSLQPPALRVLPRLGLTMLAVVTHLLWLVAPLSLVGLWPALLASYRCIAFLCLMTVWTASEVWFHPPERLLSLVTPQQRLVRWLPYVIGLCLSVGFWIALLERTFQGHRPLTVGFFAGCGLMLLGVCLRMRAIRTLGIYFLNDITLLHKHPLCTRGIYGVLRHPSEAGTLCLALGGMLVLSSLWGGLLMGCFLSPAILLRISLEDRLLQARHSIAYEEYASQVPALWPRFCHDQLSKAGF